MANIEIDKSGALTLLLGVGGGIVTAYLVATILNKYVLPKIAPKTFPEGSKMGINLTA